MQVDFLICGAQKAGTTSLDGYCRMHPEIGMPQEKELHFFDNDDLFREGDPDYARYHRAFLENDDYRVYGESTPVYMFWPQAPARIHRYNPAMKLIVLLRNPVERAYSHWQMEKSRGLEPLPFSEAIHQESTRLTEAAPEFSRVWTYTARGHYLEQLRRLWQLFGQEQVLVLQSEMLRDAHTPLLSAISEFLGIGPFPAQEPLALNTQDYADSMTDADRQYLLSLFDEDIRGLEQELGWDLGHWRV